MYKNVRANKHSDNNIHAYYIICYWQWSMRCYSYKTDY